MATHSSVLAWRIPGMEEPVQLPSMGSHRVGHNWSDLAAATAKVSEAFLNSFHSFPFIELFSSYFHHSILQLTYPFLYLSYSAIGSSKCVFNCSNCVIHLCLLILYFFYVLGDCINYVKCFLHFLHSILKSSEHLSEKAMATPSSTLAWKTPWMEERGRLQSMGLLRVGHDWVTSLSLFTFHFHALEKEMATHSSVLAWRIPGTGEPGGLLSMGSHRVGHDWSDLAAAAAEHLYYIILNSLSGRLRISSSFIWLCELLPCLSFVLYFSVFSSSF